MQKFYTLSLNLIPTSMLSPNKFQNRCFQILFAFCSKQYRTNCTRHFWSMRKNCGKKPPLGGRLSYARRRPSLSRDCPGTVPGQGCNSLQAVIKKKLDKSGYCRRITREGEKPTGNWVVQLCMCNVWCTSVYQPCTIPGFNNVPFKYLSNCFDTFCMHSCPFHILTTSI